MAEIDIIFKILTNELLHFSYILILFAEFIRSDPGVQQR